MRPNYKLTAASVAFLIVIGFAARAQNSVSIGTQSTDPAAVLWLVGSNNSQGLILPITNNIAGMPKKTGMVVYNSGDSKIYVCDGANWTSVGAGTSGGSQTLSLTGNTLTISGTGGNSINLAASAPTAGQFFMFDGTKWVGQTLSQDVTNNTTGQTTVSGLLGKPLPSGTLPATLQYLVWDGTTTSWKFQNPPSGTLPTLAQNQILSNDGTNTKAVAVGGDLGLVTGTSGVFSITGTAGNNIVTAINSAATTGSINDSKLATISTAGKVSGTAITSGNIATSGNISTTGTLTSGATGQFAVSSTGNITKINNITTSFPANQGAASTVLTNDGLGNLSWAPAASFGSQTANFVYAAPNATAGVPSFRALVASDIPTLASSKLVGTDIATVGTITTGTWKGSVINEVFGGTNQTTYAAGDILYASAANTLSKLPAGTSNQVLTVGTGNLPTWSTPSSGWGLKGTSGTTAGTNFIGTTDAQDLVFKTNSAEYMRLTSGGKLGIGTITPALKMHIAGNGSMLRLEGTDHAYMELYNSGPTTRGGWIGYGGPAVVDLGITNEVAGGGIAFSIPSNNIKMIVANSGNVGIGTTTPISKLDVSGDLHLSQLAAAPSPTTDKLYNVGGSLFWNGTNISSGGGFSTANYIPRGNGTGMVSSSIQDDGTTASVGAAPDANTQFFVQTTTKNQAIFANQIRGGSSANNGIYSVAQSSTTTNTGMTSVGMTGANAYGVVGQANNATSTSTAVQGIIAFGGNNTPTNIGVEGTTSITSATSTNYGLKGSSTGTSAKNYGLYATASSATTNWAGYFDQGNVHIKGGLSVGATDGTYGTAGQVLTSNGSGLAPSWTTVAGGSSFSTVNTIPKGDGTTLVASNLFDNGSQVSATINNASSYAFGISNGGGAGVSGRQGLNIGATASGTENVFGIALTSNTTSSGYNDAIYAIATGSTGRTRGLAAGAYSGTVTNIGVDSYASGSGSSSNYGVYNHVSGGTSNSGVYNIVTGSASGPTYGVYNSVSGTGSYGIYTAGETYNYFSGSVGIGNATPSLALSVNGNAEKVGGGPWSSYSDKRLKKNILDFNDGLTLLSKIHPVKFKYNGLAGYKDDGTEYIGVIAQEIQQIAPYMITTVKKKMHETDAIETDLLMYNSNALTYILVNAVKEQQKLIEDQKKQIEELKAQQSQKEIATQSELNQMKAEIANIKKALGMEASAKKK